MCTKMEGKGRISRVSDSRVCVCICIPLMARPLARAHSMKNALFIRVLEVRKVSNSLASRPSRCNAKPARLQRDLLCTAPFLPSLLTSIGPLGQWSYCSVILARPSNSNVNPTPVRLGPSTRALKTTTTNVRDVFQNFGKIWLNQFLICRGRKIQWPM